MSKNILPGFECQKCQNTFEVFPMEDMTNVPDPMVFPCPHCTFDNKISASSYRLLFKELQSIHIVDEKPNSDDYLEVIEVDSTEKTMLDCPNCHIPIMLLKLTEDIKFEIRDLTLNVDLKEDMVSFDIVDLRIHKNKLPLLLNLNPAEEEVEFIIRKNKNQEIFKDEKKKTKATKY